MPTLQVRDLPEEVYSQLSYLAEKDHRSLTQEAIVLLKKGIEAEIGDRDRRKQALQKMAELGINGSDLPDPVTLVREDRDR
jgi:plasmid stability protein